MTLGIPKESATTSNGEKNDITVLPPTTAQSKRSKSGAITKLAISGSAVFPIPHQSSPYLITGVVIAMLSVVIISMAAMTVGLCARRRRMKRLQMDRNAATAFTDLQENSIDNPMYGGKKLTQNDGIAGNVINLDA